MLHRPTTFPAEVAIFMDVMRACAVLVWTLIFGVSSAAAYTDLFVFGDSLSDVGNTQAATRSTVFFVYPGSYYYQGRFSNGPVYSELLSQQLGLGTLTRSSAGGDNFAYGGAKTLGTSGISGAFINDVGEQVDDYTLNRNGDPNALYIMWAGANDLFDGQLNMAIPVGNIVDDLEQLYDDGARQFLVLNLPKLGATPAYNGTAASRDDWNNRTLAFNTTLASGLDQLESLLADISIKRFDIEGLFDQVIASPTAYGLTNITAPAAPGLEPGAFFYNDDNIVANPENYLFWDSVHPTATMHAHLADAIFDFLSTPTPLSGDFNNDGLVNLADYTVWRDTLGAADEAVINNAGDGFAGVDAGDYAVWKTNLGARAAFTSASPATVPEPNTILLVVLAGLFHVRRTAFLQCLRREISASRDA